MPTLIWCLVMFSELLKPPEGRKHILPGLREGPLLAMSPSATAQPDGIQQDRSVSKLIFFLFVFGAILLCVGVLLSIFGFQACQFETLPDCSMVPKAAGPACVVVGLGAMILARSRAQIQLREGRLRGSQADPDQAFICGESRQFAQCLIFGFLFLTSGMLISILGIWVPGCGPDWVQEALNETDTADGEPHICGFLSLQIMGPLIVLVGLCFFVIAHVKKRNSSNVDQDASEGEERQPENMEPIEVSIGGWPSSLCWLTPRWLLHQGPVGLPSALASSSSSRLSASLMCAHTQDCCCQPQRNLCTHHLPTAIPSYLAKALGH